MPGQEGPPPEIVTVRKHERYPRVIEIQDAQGSLWSYYLAPDRTPLAGHPYILARYSPDKPSGVVHLFLPYGPGQLPILLELELEPH